MTHGKRSESRHQCYDQAYPHEEPLLREGQGDEVQRGVQIIGGKAGHLSSHTLREGIREIIAAEKYRLVIGKIIHILKGGIARHHGVAAEGPDTQHRIECGHGDDRYEEGEQICDCHGFPVLCHHLVLASIISCRSRVKKRACFRRL